MKKLTIKVRTNADFFDKTADYAVIELNETAIERIKALTTAVQDLKVYKVSEFNNACDFEVVDWDAEPENGKVVLKEFEGRMECCTLNVTDNDFFWSGVYKHTEIRWETTSVPLTVLDEAGDFDEQETVSEKAA